MRPETKSRYAPGLPGESRNRDALPLGCLGRMGVQEVRQSRNQDLDHGQPHGKSQEAEDRASIPRNDGV